MKISILPIMNSVSPHPPLSLSYVKRNKRLFFINSVSQALNPEVVKVNVTKFSIQFHMFPNIKPNFLLKEASGK